MSPKDSVAGGGSARTLSRETSATAETPESDSNNKGRKSAASQIPAKKGPMTPKEKAIAGIKTVEDATEKLVSAGWIGAGQDITTGVVAHLLLQLTGYVTTETAPIVKSLAVVVKQLGEEEEIRFLATALVEEISEPIADLKQLRDSYQNRQEELEEQVRKVTEGTTDLRIEMAEIQEKNRVTAEGMRVAGEEMKEAAEEMKKAAVALQLEAKRREGVAIRELENREEEMGREGRKEATREPKLTSQELVEKAASRATYATYAGKAKMPSSMRLAIERTADKERKVLFAPILRADGQGLEGLEPAVLIEKANAALAAMRERGVEVPAWVAFRGARTLTKGDVVYDMNSKASACWLRREESRREFMVGYGAMSVIAEQDLPVMVENVPVGFAATEAAVRTLEIDNDLPEHSIAQVKWIKPIGQRRWGQKTAFMLFKFRAAEVANTVIRKGVYVGGKNNHSRKLCPEVPRCYKCQGFNMRHIAATCPHTHNVCDLCGKDHQSKDCELRDADPVHHRCVNCKTFGHGSGDRLCPTFAKLNTELNAKVPENLFKYFIIDGDEDTLELLHPPESEYHRHAAPRATAEGWTDVRGGKTKNYGGGATGKVRDKEAVVKKAAKKATDKVPEEETDEGAERIAMREQARLTDMGITTQQAGRAGTSGNRVVPVALNVRQTYGVGERVQGETEGGSDIDMGVAGKSNTNILMNLEFTT